MGFRNFRIVLGIRVLFLLATVLVLGYLIQTPFYATAAVAGIALLLQIVSLFRFIDRTNQEVTRFLRSVKFGDFSQSFTGKGLGASFQEMNAAFSEVLSQFRRTRMEAEEQHQYLQTIVQHIGVGLIAFTGSGTVQLINTAAKRLLNINHLTHLRALEPVSKILFDTLRGLKAGEKTLIKFERNNELVQLAIQATEFKMKEQRYVLASIQNIRTELEEKEMEAYQKLIRVLTHEIMNSMTPISSLASSVNDVLSSREKQESVTVDVVDIREAVQTIEKRSRGLLHFVEAYRNLTRIPKPRFKIFRVEELFKNVEHLMRTQMPDQRVRFSSKVDPVGLELTADPEMIEQVLINLLLNAFHAVRSASDGAVELFSFLDKQGHVIIDVKDNGPGISDEVKEKIFIPFFTTKKDGSGIGLSLSKEIIRLHRGGIHVHSAPGSGSVFRIVF